MALDGPREKSEDWPINLLPPLLFEAAGFNPYRRIGNGNAGIMAAIIAWEKTPPFRWAGGSGGTVLVINPDMGMDRGRPQLIPRL